MQKHVAAAGAVLGIALALARLVSAQTADPRMGRWKLKSDAPPPALNIMTYEPAGQGGMKVTVRAVNAQGRQTEWTYTTMLDGKDVPIAGHPSADVCSVTRVDDRTNEIVNKKGGKVIQVITNVLAADGRTINNTYKNYSAQGEVASTTYAVYEKQP